MDNNAIDRNKVIEKISWKNKLRKIIKKIIKGIINLTIKGIKKLGFLLLQLFEFISLAELKRYESKSLEKKLRATKIKIGFIIILIIVVIGFVFIRPKFKSTETATITTNEVVTKEKSNTKEKEEVVATKIPDASDLEVFGNVTTKINIGSVDPAYEGKTFVRYMDGDKAKVEYVKCYGIAEFTVDENCRSAEYFLNNYVKIIDPDLYNEYFKDVQGAGTYNFDTAWQNCGKSEKDKFLKYQFQYMYITYVNPLVEAVKDKYDIDLLATEAGKEFAYSIANEFATNDALAIFDKAGIKSNMKIKNVISKVQAERRRSVGIYTYTKDFKYDDEDRQNAITNIDKQTKAFNKLLK